LALLRLSPNSSLRTSDNLLPFKPPFSGNFLFLRGLSLVKATEGHIHPPPLSSPSCLHTGGLPCPDPSSPPDYTVSWPMGTLSYELYFSFSTWAWNPKPEQWIHSSAPFPGLPPFSSDKPRSVSTSHSCLCQTPPSRHAVATPFAPAPLPLSSFRQRQEESFSPPLLIRCCFRLKLFLFSPPTPSKGSILPLLCQQVIPFGPVHGIRAFFPPLQILFCRNSFSLFFSPEFPFFRDPVAC